MGREWKPLPTSWERITVATHDIVHRCEVEIEDNTIFHDIKVRLPRGKLDIYKKAEKQLRIELENAPDKITDSAVAAYTLCKQIANGGFYDDTKSVQDVHEEKVDAVQELVESLQGNPLLLFFMFRHDKQRLLRRFPNAEVIDGQTNANETRRIVGDRWDRDWET